MMKCKQALVKADGDMDKAIDILREEGIAVSAKKAGRTAADGVVLAYTDEDKNVSVLVEVNSETDFVAKNEKFTDFVKAVAKTIADNNPADVDALLADKLDGKDETVQESLQELVLSIGENMKIRRFVRQEGVCSTYIHMGGAVGVLVSFDVAPEIASKDEFKAMGKDVAMQIAAMSPSYLNPESVPADVLEHEEGIISAQLKRFSTASSRANSTSSTKRTACLTRSLSRLRSMRMFSSMSTRLPRSSAATSRSPVSHAMLRARASRRRKRTSLTKLRT